MRWALAKNPGRDPPTPLRVVPGQSQQRRARRDGANRRPQVMAEDADELIAEQIGLHGKPRQRHHQRFIDGLVESPDLTQVLPAAFLVEPQHRRSQRAKLPHHSLD